jgi:hypothetical protein
MSGDRDSDGGAEFETWRPEDRLCRVDNLADSALRPADMVWEGKWKTRELESVMKRYWKRVVCAVVALQGVAAVWGGSASGLDHCTAVIRAKDSVILTGAKNVSGALLWGWTGTETNPMADPACVNITSKSAAKCTLGTGAVAITPPPLCVLYLKDAGGTCAALIKKCTPGTRPLLELPNRFVDNGDGTVTDTRTGLMWEKKAGTLGGGASSDPENPNNYYTWSDTVSAPDGTLFTDFLPRVNGTLCADYARCAGLGEHSDWRLPTIDELRTIVDLTAPGCRFGSPCIAPVFGPTPAGDYLSSTTVDGQPYRAWYVYFGDGDPNWDYKNKPNFFYARAVRGGS